MNGIGYFDVAGADGRIIRKEMLQGSSGRVLTWFTCYRIRTVCRLLWTGRLILKFKKGQEFLGWCRDSEFLKKYAALLDCCNLFPCAYWPMQIQRFTKTLPSAFLYLIYKPLWGGDSPSEGLHTKRTAETTKMQTYVLASSGIRTHYPSFRTVENSTHLTRLLSSTGYLDTETVTI
jgi:hypothetical protein